MKHIAEIAHVGRLTSSAAAFALLAALFVSGCETSSTVSSGPNPVKCVVALNAPPMMEAVGGTGSLSITTQRECAWDASSNVGWISALSPASGQGPADVSFTVSANEGLSARDGIIEVNGTQARVSQRAICRYEVSPSSQNVGASGAVGRIIITTAAECAWRATAESEWIELTSSTAGAGSGTVTFAVRLNDGAQRTAAISIAGQRALITQASSPAPAPGPAPPAPGPAPPAPGPAPPSPPPTPPPPSACKYSIAPTSQNVAGSATTGTVNVTADAGCTWTAASGVPWITVTSGTSGTGNGPVGFSVAANTGSARSGTMAIAGQTFTVNQAACTYSISPTGQNVSVGATTGTVTVTADAGCTWTATSGVPWITLISGTSGTGNGPVGFSVAANTGSARSGTMTIAGQTFTVNQAACTYSISPESDGVGPNDGAGSVNVSTTSSCQWTAASNVPWMTIASGSSGTGNGTVVYRFLVNPGARRTGTLTIAGRTFTVMQGSIQQLTREISP